MVLERLELRNFQRHKSFALELDPHVTTLCGKSDAGKSAILRSLRWLACNRPAGDAFVRLGAKGARVRLVVDGQALIRRKAGGRNEYRVDGAVYRAFGSGVPADVERVLNLSTVTFQGQHAAPFWFALTPGEVSRELNSVVNLGLIDRVLATVAREVRQATAVLGVSAERLTAAKARRRELAWVSAAAAAMAELEQQCENLKLSRDKRRRLAEQLQTARTLARGLRTRHKRSQAACRALRRLGGLRDRAVAACTNKQVLERLVVQLGQVEEQACRSKTEYVKAKAVLEQATRGRCPTCLRPL